MQKKHPKVYKKKLLIEIENESKEKTDNSPINISGTDYCGVIIISDINISLPVASEFNLTNLKSSPCCYAGAPISRNMVIAGHNYSSHFGKLKGIHPKSEVIFIDTLGNEFVYSIDCVEVLSAWQVEEMVTGNWDLSLFTCTDVGTARLTIRCVLKDNDRSISPMRD